VEKWTEDSLLVNRSVTVISFDIKRFSGDLSSGDWGQKKDVQEV